MHNVKLQAGTNAHNGTDVGVSLSSQPIAKPNVGGSLFNVEALEKRIQELKDLPPFTPDKYEPRYTVTQLFESGVECTLHFVIRNGEQIWYKSEQRVV